MITHTLLAALVVVAVAVLVGRASARDASIVRGTGLELVGSDGTVWLRAQRDGDATTLRLGGGKRAAELRVDAGVLVADSSGRARAYVGVVSGDLPVVRLRPRDTRWARRRPERALDSATNPGPRGRAVRVGP